VRFAGIMLFLATGAACARGQVAGGKPTHPVSTASAPQTSTVAIKPGGTVEDDAYVAWRENGGKETQCQRIQRYVLAAEREARRCMVDDDCVEAPDCAAIHRDADREVLQRWSREAFDICLKSGVTMGTDCKFCELGPPKCTSGFCVREETRATGPAARTPSR